MTGEEARKDKRRGYRRGAGCDGRDKKKGSEGRCKKQ